MSARFDSVEALLADARSRLERITAARAAREAAAGARLVDIRPDAQRRSEGEIPGSLIIERNHLEWRLHPRSDARVPGALPDQRWIVVCSEGYTSSLAADALRSLGVDATDIVGGFAAWQRDGLPTVSGGTPAGSVVAGRPAAAPPDGATVPVTCRAGTRGAVLCVAPTCTEPPTG